MINENDIAMLLAVVFGFICGWVYFWCIFKPKQKRERIKDYSGDRLIISTHDGHEVFNSSIACMHDVNTLYNPSGKGSVFERTDSNDRSKLVVIYQNNTKR